MKRVTIVVLAIAVCLTGCTTLQEAETEKSNIDTVKQAYAYFKQADVPGFMSLLTEDCEIILPGAPEYVPWGGTYIGPDGYAQFLAKVAENVDFLNLEYLDYSAEGDEVLLKRIRMAR